MILIDKNDLSLAKLGDDKTQFYLYNILNYKKHEKVS
jgi:hypothetical protein